MPLLEAGHAKPLRCPVLVSIKYGMACGEMMVRIQPVQHNSYVMCPCHRPKGVQVITKIPSNISKGCQTRRCVTKVTPLICASRNRMHFGVVPSKNDRNDHPLLAGIIQHPFKFLPIGAIERRVVKLRICDILRPSGNPWIEIRAKSIARLDRFGPEMIRSTIEKYPNSIHFEV